MTSKQLYLGLHRIGAVPQSSQLLDYMRNTGLMWQAWGSEPKPTHQIFEAMAVVLHLSTIVMTALKHNSLEEMHDTR